MTLSAVRAEVANRGRAPFSFLVEIVAWAKSAPDEIFVQNDNPRDIYATEQANLGLYTSILNRKAVMLEVMRVHAGFESSWNWEEGVDLTNHHSLAHIDGQETGIFQVSFDSTYLSKDLQTFAEQHYIETPEKFIKLMKMNHALALEYYARLLRVSVSWAGPIKRHEIDRYLSRDAVKEFEQALAEA